MLVGATQYAGIRDAHVGHLGPEPDGQFVVAENFRKPTALVHELAEWLDDHALDDAFLECHQIFLAISGKGMDSLRASSLAWARLG